MVFAGVCTVPAAGYRAGGAVLGSASTPERLVPHTPQTSSFSELTAPQIRHFFNRNCVDVKKKRQSLIYLS
jgi:hypothetical protein